MIDYLNGNMVFVKQDKDGLFIQTPVFIDFIDTQINFVKDAVVNDKLIGILENYQDPISGNVINNVHYVDLASKSVYSYDFGLESVYGLFCYKDVLYVFTESKVYFITGSVITNKNHGFVLRGFDLVNPFTFIILDITDVPTVCLFSILELLRFKDEIDYTLIKSDFASVYIPNEWFDYNNVILKDGYIYVRGKNGLSILKLDYVGTYGTIMKVEKIYNTYKPIFQDELYEQGINLLQFLRKVNNSVYWFFHEKTGRNIFLIDDFYVLGDVSIVFDRNWFFDLEDKKLYRYSFSSELGDWFNYKKNFLSFHLNNGKVFRGFGYDVFESKSQFFDVVIVSMFRKQEKSYRFLLDVDKKDFLCNVYGESFILNLFFTDRTRMKINEIKLEKEV